MGRLTFGGMALATVGLALSWFFFPPGALQAFFPGAADTPFFQLWNEVLLLAVAVAGVAAVFLRTGIERLWARRRFAAFALAEALAVAGYSLLIAPVAAGLGVPEPLELLAIPFLACGYVLLVLLWACTLSRLAPSQAVLCAVASVLVYAVLSLFQLGTASAGIAGGVLTTCVSGLLWFAVRVPAGADGGQAAGFSPSPAVLRQLPRLQIGLVALFLVGGRITVGLFFDYFKDAFPVELFARNVLTAIVMAFALIRLRGAGDPFQRAYSAWVPVALVLLFGTLLELASGGTAAAIGCGVINGMLRCFECIAYIMLIQFVQERAASSVLVFGLWFVLLKALPLLVQRCLTAQVAHLLGLSPDLFAVPIIFIAMVLISGALAFMSRRPSPVPGLRTCPDGGDGGDGPARFDELCAVAGLTPREREIVRLIARGNSQKRIGELLGLSYSTVQSYSKTIYAKMDVHSKQELVDLIGGAPDRPAP